MGTNAFKALDSRRKNKRKKKKCWEIILETFEKALI